MIRPMNGEEVRDTRFMSGAWGYDVTEVDDLLRRVAVELDAGRSAGPLIENVTFRRAGLGRSGSDVDAVDWLLNQLLSPLDDSELAEMSTDPWRELAVAQVTRSRVSDLTERSAKPSGRAHRKSPSEDRKLFPEECANAWRDFGHLPGKQFLFERVSLGRYELRTAEQQKLASVRRYGLSETVSTDGGRFTLKRTRLTQSPPDVAEIAARGSRNCAGQFLTPRSSRRKRWEDSRGKFPVKLKELADETGTPILHTTGVNQYGRACACISFPSQGWLRFLVRGTERADAVMTAVDQAGNRVARYRINDGGRKRGAGPVEITVNPAWKLTNERLLAIAISAPWLGSYFVQPGAGGG